MGDVPAAWVEIGAKGVDPDAFTQTGLPFVQFGGTIEQAWEARREGSPGEGIGLHIARDLPRGLGGDLTYALYENFLECVRGKKRDTFSTPELGAAAFTTVAMGVKSYREGKALFWDKEHRKVTDADPGWAQRWEARSKKRGQPSHIMGWQGGATGSTLQPPDYMKLAGPWINGKDPAEGA